MLARLHRAVVAVTVLVASGIAAPSGAALAAPRRVDPSYLQVIAHQDDDLFFMNPDVDAAVASGLPSVTVYLTAGQLTGDGNTDELRARNRQRGVENAYATMAGAADGDDTTQLEWQGYAVQFAGRNVELYLLRQQPQVQLIFLNLHDGELRNIDTGGTNDTVIPTGGVVTTSLRYNRADLVQTLTAIMNVYRPSVLRTTDAEPDRRAGYTPDHTDHVSAARFAREAPAAHLQPLVEVDYRAYNIADVPQNLSPSQVNRKTQILNQYLRYDQGTRGVGDNWLNRMYRRWPQGTGWVTRDDAGAPEAFVVLNGLAYDYRQDSAGDFVGATALADPRGRLAPGLSVVRGPDGRLNLFAHRLSDHHIVLLSQDRPAGSFGRTWIDLGSPNAGLDNADQVGTPAASLNADGRLQVFVKNGGGGLGSLKQATPNGAWTPTWLDLGGVDLQDGLSTVTGPQGLIEVYASTRTAVIRWNQTRLNGDVVRDPVLMSSLAPASPPETVVDSSGRISIVYRRAGNGNLLVMPQIAVGGAFRSPVDLGGSSAGTDEPGTALAPDGRVLIFARNAQGGVSVARQTTSNVNFSQWQSLAGTAVGAPAAVLGDDERVTVFSVGATGLAAARQAGSGLDQPFDDWEDLGM